MEKYESNLELNIKEYCDAQGVEDIKKLTPNEWSAVLQYLGDYIYKIEIKMQNPPAVEGNIYKTGYDVYYIYILVTEYIRLSRFYNKIVYAEDACLLCGIDNENYFASFKGARAFENYDVNNIMADYKSNIIIYKQYIKDYYNIKSNNSNITIYNNINLSKIYNDIMNIYKKVFNNDKVNYIKYIIYNKLASSKRQTFNKKLEASNQGFSYAYLGNNNKGFTDSAEIVSNEVISLDSIKNAVRIAQQTNNPNA